MGYNDVFKDIIQPIKTSYHCVGESKVPMQIERIWDGTPLDGIDHVIVSIRVRVSRCLITRLKRIAIDQRAFWNCQKTRYHYKPRTIFRLLLARWHSELIESTNQAEPRPPGISEVKAPIRKSV